MKINNLAFFLFFFIGFNSNTSLAQTSISTLLQIPGKHESNALVLDVCQKLTLDNCFDCTQWRSKPVIWNLNSEGFITAISLNFDSRPEYNYSGELPCGITSNMKIKAVLKIIGKNAIKKTKELVVVNTENSTIEIHFNKLEKGRMSNIFIKYNGEFEELIFKDTDADGLFDYKDRCEKDAGMDYNYGCPLKESITYKDIKPDTLFNRQFMDIYSDYKNDFKNIRKEVYPNNPNGTNAFSVISEMTNFVDQFILVDSDNQSTFIGVFAVTDSYVTADSLYNLLIDKLQYGQMNRYILEGSRKKVNGEISISKILMVFPRSPYSNARSALIVSRQSIKSPLGKYCICIEFGNNRYY